MSKHFLYAYRNPNFLPNIMSGVSAALLTCMALFLGPLLIEGLVSGARAATIVSLASSKCIDVAGGQPNDGADVQIYSCHDGDNQEWSMTKDGEIRGLGGKCLDVRGNTPADQTPVQIYACNGGANQRWEFTAAGEIRGLAGKCLDVRGDVPDDQTPLQIYTCHGGVNQHWAFAMDVAFYVDQLTSFTITDFGARQRS